MTMNQYIVYLVIRINVEILMCLVIRSHGSTSALCNSHIVFSYKPPFVVLYDVNYHVARFFFKFVKY